MRGVTGKQSLFSRHRASSVERELARTPYAFRPKPREIDEHSDILTQRLVGPDIQPGDLETIKKAKEQILDPFEDDINVRLAKERLFGGYSKSGSRAPSPTIFPTNTDFERKLKQDNNNFENVLFGPNVSFDTNSIYSEKLSDTSSIRTTLPSDKVKSVQNKPIVNQNNNLLLIKSDSASDKSSNVSLKTRNSSPVSRESYNRRTSDILGSIKDNKSDISSNSSVSKLTVVKSKPILQRSFSVNRSESNDTNDTVEEDLNKNIINPLVSEENIDVKAGEPAFKVREFVHLKDNFDDDVVYSKDIIANISEPGVEKFRRSRALAEGYTEKYFRSTSRLGNVDSQESRDTGSDEGKDFATKPILTTSVSLPSTEPFKILAAPKAAPSVDLESVSSTVSSIKLPPARTHRISAFAILGDAVAPSAAPAAVPLQSSETESQASSSVVPPVVPIVPIVNPSGRVSPFRGRGFKVDSQSRHTTPRTSRAASPLRSRTNSLSKVVEATPKVDSRNPLVYERSPTPARNYIKENIEEVKELSEFNRERNLELAEQKRLEEEIEILKDLGVIDPQELSKMAKTNLRSRSGSPSALLHYENISVPNSRIINTRDGFDVLGRKPPKVSPRNVISLPQSKTGSPTHRARIPKRQRSLTPPVDESDYFNEPSIMVNALSQNGRFISNSTSSIYENRVFSVITDVDDKPIDISPAKVRSKSSSNLIPGPSILKTKPPRSPARPGPPPSHMNLNSKRLSPIIATPDKSPVPDPMDEQITFQGKSFTQIKTASQNAKTNAERAGKTKGSIYEKSTGRKIESKSKPGTPKVMSPTRVPRRPSKSLVTSPTTSRTPSKAPSRAPSRGPPSKTPGKEPNPLKKTPSATKFTAGAKPSYSKNTNYTAKDERMSTRSNSSDTEKKFQLKRVNSRSSIVSKIGASTTGKPDLKRVDSRNSIKPLTRTNSIKSIRDKTKRRPSMKDLDESTEESSGKGKSTSRSKPKKSTERKETNTEDIDKQDMDTQYDKTSDMDFNFEKLIPLTKTNVVSMTTAAITAQPLEIAAKVTSQLPSALEKARERGVFEKNSSSDSLAAKMLGEVPKTEEAPKIELAKEKSTLGDNLQKTSSKTSITSTKDDKDAALKRSDSIILPNNVKLKPIKTPLDPKVQNVKMKIDNILNSSQSSFEDIREKIKKHERAAERSAGRTTTAVIEKKPDDVSDKIEDASKKVDEVRKKLDETVTKADVEIKKAEQTVAKVEEKVDQAAKDVKSTIQKANDEIKTATKEIEKDAAAVLTKKVSEKGLTPVEIVIKPEASTSEMKTTPAHTIEVAKVAEVVKKETLTPTVTIVNEKARGTSEEHVTEKIIKGEPDVEVQSGNIKMEKKTVVTNLEHSSDSSSVANGASTSNGKGKTLPAEGNGSTEDTRAGVSMVSSPAMDEEAAGEEVEEGGGEGDGKRKGCCGGRSIFPCCKSKNLSEVQLIDENLGKKRASKSEMSQASGAKGEADMKKKGCADRLLCCRGKNKVRDSSVPRPSIAASDATGRMSKASSVPPKPRGRCASIFCCCCKPKDVERRDSILSQKPKQKWYKRICCCGKKGSMQASRRTSMFSKKRSLSQAVPLQEDKRTKLDNSLIEHTSMLRGAIPALPISLAWICLVCNIIVPGLGTILSGMFCLCFGRPRFGVYDGWKPRIGAFLIDLIVGVGQLFCVLFCLVGWGWSIWWATIIIRVAKKYAKLKMTSSDPEMGNAAANNHRTNNNA